MKLLERGCLRVAVFYKSFIESQTLSSLQSATREAACVKLGHLIGTTESSLMLLNWANWPTSDA